MPAQQFNFTPSSDGGDYCEQGASFSFNFTWEKEYPPDSETYVPVDISLFTAKMQVKAKKGSDPLIVELSTTNGRITFDGPNGVVFLTIDATTTNALQTGVFKYDLELTDSSGNVTRLVEGSFTIKEQITI